MNELAVRNHLPSLFQSDSLLSRFFGHEWSPFNIRTEDWYPITGEFHPSVKATDEDVKYIIKVPGFKKDDIKVKVENDYLSIIGESKDEYLGTQKFSEKFPLASTLNYDGVSAKVNDGVLIITIPIKEESKPKVIDVTVE